ncbi:hypothetical protein ADUPG1_013580 [Aduncisulcus paluster]|uniref:Uncharacterized protein n=1 Tax=Aduncisulcus paluster TaxID=2918883 RepID=A0ABQ5K3F8_9EUKA|nr:hypothetical protein ADUPG1_013580 [Aduncisulcus paluster]
MDFIPNSAVDEVEEEDAIIEKIHTSSSEGFHRITKADSDQETTIRSRFHRRDSECSDDIEFLHRDLECHCSVCSKHICLSLTSEYDLKEKSKANSGSISPHYPLYGSNEIGDFEVFDISQDSILGSSNSQQYVPIDIANIKGDFEQSEFHEEKFVSDSISHCFSPNPIFRKAFKDKDGKEEQEEEKEPHDCDLHRKSISFSFMSIPFIKEPRMMEIPKKEEEIVSIPTQFDGYSIDSIYIQLQAQEGDLCRRKPDPSDNISTIHYPKTIFMFFYAINGMIYRRKCYFPLLGDLSLKLQTNLFVKMKVCLDSIFRLDIYQQSSWDNSPFCSIFRLRISRNNRIEDAIRLEKSKRYLEELPRRKWIISQDFEKEQRKRKERRLKEAEMLVEIEKKINYFLDISSPSSSSPLLPDNNQGIVNVHNENRPLIDFLLNFYKYNNPLALQHFCKEKDLQDKFFCGTFLIDKEILDSKNISNPIIDKDTEVESSHSPNYRHPTTTLSPLGGPSSQIAGFQKFMFDTNRISFNCIRIPFTKPIPISSVFLNFKLSDMLKSMSHALSFSDSPAKESDSDHPHTTS